jgi:hypothetical protein
LNQFGNAAQRLHALLVRAKSISGADSCQQAWASLLRVDPADVAGLLHRLSPVMALPQKVRKEVDEAGLDSIYLSHFNEIEQAFGIMNFHIKWEQFLGSISEQAPTSLGICAHRLSEGRPEAEVTDEAIEELSVGARELIDEVREAEVSDDLRLYLLRQLRRVEAAIHDYPIIGPDALREAYHIAVGEAVVQPDLHDELHKAPVSKQFWNFVQHAALTLSVVHTSLALPATIAELAK